MLSLKFVEIERIGALGEGASLTELDDDAIFCVKRMLSQCGVLAFREQFLSDDEFEFFLDRLGPRMVTIGEPPLIGYPRLNQVSNVGREQAPKSVFHTDTSYVQTPPAYTALRAVRVPSQGGETVFTNQYTAWETLPEDQRKDLIHEEVLHISSGVELNDDDESECWHPLVRVHPISGKLALFLTTPVRCVRLKNRSEQESKKIIQALYEHSTRETPTFRHQWQAGDVLIWDNRCTLHKGDHTNVVGDRVLHRGMVCGEVPVAASLVAVE